MLLSSVDLFKINSSKNSFRKTFSVGGMDPDQEHHFAHPDLSRKLLSADDKVVTNEERVNKKATIYHIVSLRM